MISSESELELESEGLIPADLVMNAGGTGGRKVVVGAEVEKRVELG
jgi:hypothetical protein